MKPSSKKNLCLNVQKNKKCDSMSNIENENHTNK